MSKIQRPEDRGQRAERPKAKTKTQIKIFLFFGFFVFLPSAFCLLPSVVFAQSISSIDLISNAKHYDNTVVIYEGELIGNILGRGEFVWLNLFDGKNALGVWIKRSLADGVKRGGNYKNKGDSIRVAGIFSRACPQHGGGLDIHATTLTVVKEGFGIEETLSVKKMLALGMLLGVFVCLWIVHILQVKRARK